VRKAVFEIGEFKVTDFVPELGAPVGDVLLAPTRIYVKPIRRVLSYYKVKNVVHGIAHITGGGLQENLERIFPANCELRIEPDSWPVPPVFPWLQKLGNIDDSEMARVFIRGIGLALVVSAYYADSILRTLADCGLQAWNVGQVVERT
jgi:phosphoribosylformylglycinamidine cyclo-ligase